MSEERAAPIAEVIDELARHFRRGSDAFGPDCGGEAADAGGRDAPGAVGGVKLESDDAFNRVALKVHAAQRAANPVLRDYWSGTVPAEPAAWHEIPPVAVQALREVAICAGAAEAVFRTSGTTGGHARRGEHHVASLALYRAAARNNYRHHLFAHAPLLRIISLVPCPGTVPDSSLGTMAGFISREPEVVRATWAFDPEHGVDIEAVRRAVTAAVAGGPPDTAAATPDLARSAPPAGAEVPILLLTTAFALVQLLDALAPEALPFPPGSRIMETGGFKGRVAEVDRNALYGRVTETLGVPESHIVNEYGMTEMLSQAYDCVAGKGPPPGERVHRFPPWVRTRALDPADLSPLPPGRPGLLAHFDLANAGSVCHLLTEDYGATTDDGGVRLAGRAPGASLRGCSVVAESFLRATGRGGGARPATA